MTLLRDDARPRLRGCWRGLATLLLAAGLGVGMPLDWASVEGGSLEAQLKAVVLTKVLLFVDLGRRDRGSEVLTIGILGESGLVPHLAEAFEGSRLQYGRLRIERVATLAELEGLDVDVLFVPSRASVDQCTLIAYARRRRMLTVTDNEAATEGGIMIGLVRDGNRIAIRVNNDEAQAAGIRISSKLLQLSRVVRTQVECR